MKTVSLCIALAFAALPLSASAQMFWQSPDYRGAPVAAGEPGIGIPLPGATPEEERAALAWQLRSGLNVMALQCQFDRTMLTENTYNTVLTNHRSELEAAYAKLTAYFKRTIKTPRAAQSALDTYGTKTYSGFSTVRSQLGFCQTASRISHAAAFAPRGSFTILAVERLRELRNSLIPQGEQYFRFGRTSDVLRIPNFDRKCWRGNAYKTQCGVTRA